MKKRSCVVFTGGGSGGHVIPALTLIKALGKEYQVQYIGSESGIEKDLVLSAEIPFKSITTGKLRRYLSFENFLDMFRVLVGIFECYVYLFKFSRKETIVFSTGGFVSVPVVISAWLRRIPILVHEQTTRMGLANKIASFFAKKIFISFSESAQFLPAEKTVFTGYPIRQDLLSDRVDKIVINNIDLNKLDRPILFITGGGNGSHLLNQKTKESLKALSEKFFILHQVGAKYIDEFQVLNNEHYQAVKFLNKEMSDVLKISNIIISRAGAGTVCELIYINKASIFIPLAIAQKNEQYHNAMEAKRLLGSHVVQEKELDEQSLVDLVKQFEQRELENKNEKVKNGTNAIIDQIRSI